MSVLLNILKTFEINKSFFLMIGLFVVTYWVVSEIALKKLSAYLIERDLRLEGRVNEASKLRVELQAISEQLDVATKAAQKEASESFAKIRAKALDEQRKILNDAKGKATSQIAATRESVQATLNAELKKVESDLPAVTRLIIDQLLSGKKKISSNKELTQFEV